MSKGCSKDGADFVLKALHPAGNGPTAHLPDESVSKVVNPELRAEVVIGAPPFVSGGGARTWDVLIWKPPGDATHFMYATGPGGTDFNHYPFDGTNFVPWNGPAGNGQISSSVEWVTAQRMVDAGFFQGNEVPDYNGGSGVSPSAVVIPNPDGAPGTHTINVSDNMVQHVGRRIFALNAPEFRPARWRTTHSSLTAYLTASAVFDEGSVHALQTPNTFRYEHALESRHTDVPSSTGNIVEGATVPWTPAEEFSTNDVRIANVVAVTEVPFDTSTMYLSDPEVYAGPAKDGVYLPLTLTGDHEYVETGQFPWITQVDNLDNNNGDVNRVFSFVTVPDITNVHSVEEAHPTSAPYPTLTLRNRVLFTDGDGTRYRYAPVTMPNLFGLPKPIWAQNSGIDEVSQGVIIFEGLDPNATLTIKSILGLEIIPTTASPLLALVKIPTNPDRIAMEMYERSAIKMRKAMPASFNNFGDILRDIASVVQAVAPVVATLFPEAAPIIGLVDAGATAIKTFVPSSQSQSPQQAKRDANTTVARKKLRKQNKKALAAQAAMLARPGQNRRIIISK